MMSVQRNHANLLLFAGVQERVGGNTSMHGLVLSDAPYVGILQGFISFLNRKGDFVEDNSFLNFCLHFQTREVKASNHNQHCGSSANNHSRYHQKS